MKSYRQTHTVLSTERTRHLTGLNGHLRTSVTGCIAYLDAVVGLSLFATEDVHSGIASPGCKSGDTICTFYVRECLYILRQPEEKERPNGSKYGSNTAELCGVTYIPHLMDQHQRETARLKSDEIFVVE
jgi:hypothetical protein